MKDKSNIEYVSVCCGARAIDESLGEDQGVFSGICGKCKDGSEFEPVEKEIKSWGGYLARLAEKVNQ